MQETENAVTVEGNAPRNVAAAIGDEAIIERADVSVRHRIRIELQIARKTIRTLKAAGFALIADNGEEESHGSERQLIDNLFACDEAHLLVRGNGKSGWVFFVLGNDGYDVICDYTVNLEPWLSEVNDYADKLEDEGR